MTKKTVVRALKGTPQMRAFKEEQAAINRTMSSLGSFNESLFKESLAESIWVLKLVKDVNKNFGNRLGWVFVHSLVFNKTRFP